MFAGAWLSNRGGVVICDAADSGIDIVNIDTPDAVVSGFFDNFDGHVITLWADEATAFAEGSNFDRIYDLSQATSFKRDWIVMSRNPDPGSFSVTINTTNEQFTAN